jgi:hypothetical protein
MKVGMCSLLVDLRICWKLLRLQVIATAISSRTVDCIIRMLDLTKFAVDFLTVQLRFRKLPGSVLCPHASERH